MPVRWQAVMDRAVEVVADLRGRGVRPTVRTVFYSLASTGHIPLTRSAYQSLCRHFVTARKEGRATWDGISDETRRAEGGDNGYYDPVAYGKWWVDYVLNADRKYALPRWKDQPGRVEVWLEKFALADTFRNWLECLNVALVPSRGYASWTLIWEAALRLRETAKPTVILYFGDFDPSGADIQRFLKEALEGFNVEAEVRRVAVTKEQVEAYRLPYAPEDAAEAAKLQRDPRFRTWPYGLYRVELDALLALQPDEFRRLVEESVNEHFDQAVYARVRTEEAEAKRVVRETVWASLRRRLGGP
ncbi:MAG: hypothetical protein QW057_04115 [Candidatus Bathyarchaeia archaeon]